jgi:dual specificity phosphatase 12
MSINNIIYNLISYGKNRKTLDIINTIACIDDYNEIIPNLYLGNIKSSTDTNFLIKNNIQTIINCTIDEPFHEYFKDNTKYKLRLKINDSKDVDNINNFKKQILEAINMIDISLNHNKPVYVHCYWGLMRSATVVASYLMKKYNMPKNDAINIIREKRPLALLSFYNFNEVLDYVELFT